MTALVFTTMKIPQKIMEFESLFYCLFVCWQDFAKQSLSYLLNEKPPLAVIQQMSPQLKAQAAKEGWFEDLIKLCLYLFLALLPVNHKLIHE